MERERAALAGGPFGTHTMAESLGGRRRRGALLRGGGLLRRRRLGLAPILVLGVLLLGHERSKLVLKGVHDGAVALAHRGPIGVGGVGAQLGQILAATLIR